MLGTVLDIETTGFLKRNGNVLSNESEIIEVGFLNIDMKTGDIFGSGDLFFYKPYFNLENDAARVHGIKRDFLKQYEQDWDKNMITLCSLMNSSVIIGKNCKSFDVPFINAFIEKHYKGEPDLQKLVASLRMQNYDGGLLFYEDNRSIIDVQELWAPFFRKLYFQQTGVSLSGQKKGTLTEYIDTLPDGRKLVDQYYDPLPKDRVSRDHGALYDAVMTYVIWRFCVINGACSLF